MYRTREWQCISQTLCMTSSRHNNHLWSFFLLRFSRVISLSIFLSLFSPGHLRPPDGYRPFSLPSLGVETPIVKALSHHVDDQRRPAGEWVRSQTGAVRARVPARKREKEKREICHILKECEFGGRETCSIPMAMKN